MLTQPQILNIKELKAATGYDKPGLIEKCLKNQGIRYFYGAKGNIWTTVDLINMAGGITPTTLPTESHEELI